MARVLHWRVLSLTGMVFYLVQSKVGTITVICMWSDGPPCGVELRWVVLSTDQPAMTKRGSKAKHGLEKCMMGCRCSTGATVVSIEKTDDDWNVCSYQIFSLQWKSGGEDGFVLAVRALNLITFNSVTVNENVRMQCRYILSRWGYFWPILPLWLLKLNWNWWSTGLCQVLRFQANTLRHLFSFLFVHPWFLSSPPLLAS